MSIRTEIRGAAYWITFDHAKRSNAILFDMYNELCRAMDDANENEETMITVFTGAGDYYSTGNDFTLSEMVKHNMHAELDHEAVYSRWMRRLINHRKIMIGLVNGPAMGIACTTIGLLDYVVCSDSAYFLCPFANIGVSPEGNSTVLFARIMGTSNATEMLLFNERMTAQQALERGFVSKVFSKAEFAQKSAELVEKYCKLPKHSLLASKELMRGASWRREMNSVNNHEYDLVRKLFVDQRSIDLIMKRFDKSNL
ncbi:hypothetical protein PRIPAC_80177 [Pristionchus pacificus]|uniref:Uncharacterized protein n=1 Tax=Pristionchus pacificus TaxID=54126 RepID=A0A2A6CQE4_PRIPA|nr:hypothetical protein PRIPAC_80177 [Pristionchus pacificus]|eukprot:PDM80263.1 hypothetical protein PRIPAC_32842 [Pristionchus pacificus]